MKKLFQQFIFITLFAVSFAFNHAAAQIPVTVTNPGNVTPNLAASYTSFALALTDLNNVTAMSGPVTLTLTGLNSEIAPADGFTIGSATLNLVTGVTKTVNIVKGAEGPVTLFAGVGTQTPGSAVQDGILKLVGANWIIIDGLTLTDENTSNPETMEYGIGLFKASATDGCVANIIKNCIITLNRINNASGSGPAVDGSRGINLVNSLPTTQTTATIVSSGLGSNSGNKFYTNVIQNCNIGVALIGFVSAAPYSFTDQSNDVGGSSSGTGNIIKNFGGGAATNPAAGIRTLAQYYINISYNAINNNDGAGLNHANTLYGIFSNTARSASVNITNNTITLKSLSNLTAIENVAGATAENNTVNINSNTITGCNSISGFAGINTTASAANVNINNNTLFSNSTNATGGVFNLIKNTGAVTTALNINDNTINGWTFNSATNLTFNGIITSGTVTAALSISRNSFQSITHSLPGIGAHFYISYTNSSSNAANINNNKFIDLDINISGNVYFLYRSGNLTATGSEHCDSNSIVTAFNKAGSTGNVYFLRTNGHSFNGSTIINNFNNFSNVTVSDASQILGWENNEGVSGTNGPAKTITNNTFNNLNVATGSVFGMIVDFSGGPSIVSNNIVSNITSNGPITGIDIRLSNSTTMPITVSNNYAGAFTSTGASAVVTGIRTQTLTNMFKNKIFDLESNGPAASVNGILIPSGTTVGIFNNLIGNLSAPSTSSTIDAVRGINITSTTSSSNLNISYNTIFIPAQTSTGANFSSSGIFHTASTTSTTAQLNMRNNIIVNLANPNGTGNTVAYRRSDIFLDNYNPSSNNNLFFAGVPGSSRLIFSDGTNSDQTMPPFKTRVAPRDAQSISENPNFLSVAGLNSDFLHINPNIVTQIENGGVNILGITDDFDGDIRSITTPDIGADEFKLEGTLELTMIMEGFYVSAEDSMRINDTVTVYLRNDSSPYAKVDSARSIIEANTLTGSFAFTNAPSGNYYIQTKHRNTIETWSASAFGYTPGATTSYNFTTSAAQAFGNNMIQVDALPLRFGIYSGDVNQDGVVDGSDTQLIDNDATNYESGYLPTDINGDNFIDGTDAQIAGNNSDNFVLAIVP